MDKSIYNITDSHSEMQSPRITADDHPIETGLQDIVEADTILVNNSCLITEEHDGAKLFA